MFFTLSHGLYSLCCWFRLEKKDLVCVGWQDIHMCACKNLEITIYKRSNIPGEF